MNSRMIQLTTILLMLFANFIPAKSNKQVNVNAIRITHTTWDRQSSILIGSDREKVQQRIITAEDSSITEKIIVSNNAVNYIGNFIKGNSKDSIGVDKLDRAYAVNIKIYTNRDTLEFYIQQKNSDNFLERLINNMQSSPFSKEYTRIVYMLKKYDRLNKVGQ